MNSGYAKTCFVSDMSTGYSGNMGFKMPQNWNLDQFAEITTDIYLTTYNRYWSIDKVSYKGTFPVVTELNNVINTEPVYDVAEGEFVLESDYRKHISSAKLYSGRKLFVSITLTDENGKPVNDGTEVDIKISRIENTDNDEPYVTPMPIFLSNAVPDGTTYTIKDFLTMDKDFLIINDYSHYYITYELKDGFKSKVRVKVTMKSVPL